MPQDLKISNDPIVGKLGKKTPYPSLVAIGSNVALTERERLATVAKSLVLLEKRGYSIRACSRMYRTPAFPKGAGPDFVNAVVTVEGASDPRLFLADLHKIEAELGRTRQKRWEMRTLDMDMLAFGNQCLPDAGVVRHWMDLPLDEQMTLAPDGLVLPHPRIQDRAFVLVPLADVAPDWVHPVLGRTTLEMLEALPEPLKSEVIVIE